MSYRRDTEALLSRDRDLQRGEPRRQWAMPSPPPASEVPSEKQLAKLHEAFEEEFVQLADDLGRFGAPTTRDECFRTFGRRLWNHWETIKRKGR